MKSYQHITREERYEISAWLRAGLSQKTIAEYLGKDKSSISREVRRNKGLRGYRGKQASQKASARQESKPRKRTFTSVLQAIVEAEVRKDFSPEQIVGRAALQGQTMVSHERIYQHIHADKRSGGTLHQHLRHAAKKYRKRSASNNRRGQIANAVSIEERPCAVADRKEFGHWETDTVIGHSHEGAIVTLVERTSRYTVIGRLCGKHAEPLADCTVTLLLPFKDSVRSITADNGKEFAQHERISTALDASFYFAHPYSPWERGTNENTNGLIRQYLPKTMSFNDLTQAECQKIMDNLNNRPRKVLGFKTPAEVFITNDPTVALTG